jgi:transposase-like protein
MARSGPRKIYPYSDEFKLSAVRLSQQPRLRMKGETL